MWEELLPVLQWREEIVGQREENMPFLHGFRRIVYEYQPLVDSVMCVLGTEEGENPQHRQDGEESICRALVELLDKESQSSLFMEGISYSLFKVAELGLVSAAQVLLHYGADLNFEDPVSYYNPLHIAVLRNKPDMVQMLIDKGAGIDKRDRIHESSPLDLASEEADRLPCLRVLLDLGADVNAKDKNGKTALLHGLASSDGLTVNNADNIQLLLERGADVNATTHDGESPVSSLTFLVKEALDSSAEDAKEIGRFCTRVTHLLISHSADPSCCLNATDGEVWEPSLIYTSLEHFDMFFPLAAILLQHGASFFCSHHIASYWTGQQLIFSRLAEALREPLDATEVDELMAKAEVLLDLATIYSPVMPPLFPRSELPVLEQVSAAQLLLELYNKLEDQVSRPLALKCLCRRLFHRCLQPWPYEEKVKALPLPDRLKDLLLPELSWRNRPGWDSFKLLRTLH
ncbi:ankyrin repeat and SOCS box protein 6 isoform X1 [Xyrauchen texanus]|uniref:ankyrin repeat and SOCS box protein 6 isoform X1 n=2 Tax=Xyrauchen texanus TaxID=154827 RepID=UPI0022428086|nr:ankyrin repeat and SOCS box protein 6 isoform X1 [Xyrauchen texanus]